MSLPGRAVGRNANLLQSWPCCLEWDMYCPAMIDYRIFAKGKVRERFAQNLVEGESIFLTSNRTINTRCTSTAQRDWGAATNAAYEGSDNT